MSPRAGALATTMARQTTHRKCHSYEEKQSDVCVCVCVCVCYMNVYIDH